MFKIFKSPEQRHAARLKRLAYWAQPIDGPKRRLIAWLNLLLVDHGVFRLIYLNEHEVTPEFSRSAQPAPHDVRAMARDGIRTIINLRGGREHGGWPLQVEACATERIELREFTLRSREPPDRETLLSLPELFDNLRYPVLAHCKSGADRAGMFSALYLLVRCGASAKDARRQLSWRFGHVRLAKTGVLDAVIDAYEREGEANDMEFMDWVREVYDPAKITAEFRENYWASVLVDRILRRE